MATVAQYRAYEEVLNRVNDVRMRATVARVLDAVLGAAALGGAAVLAVTGIQALFRFEAFGREALRLTLATGLLLAVARFCFLVFRRQWGDERTARFIEAQVPQVGNSLINVLQLVRESEQWSAVLLDRAMAEAAGTTRPVDLARAVSWRRIVILGVMGAAVAGLLVAFVWGLPAQFSSALDQVLRPYAFVPTRGAVDLKVLPGNVELVRGDALRIEVRFDNARRAKYDVSVFVLAEGEAVERRLPMAPIDESASAYCYDRPEVKIPLRYRVEVGRSQSDCYRVTIREKAVITGLTATFDYPPYTGKQPQIETNASGNIRAPVGTRAALTVSTSGPVNGCALRFARHRAVPCEQAGADRARWRASWQILEDDSYEIEISSSDGPGNGAEIQYRVEAVPDQEPTVAIPLPGREVAVSPGGRVRVLVRATDDYGFRHVGLFAHPQGQPSAAPAKLWQGKDVAGQRALALDHEIVIPKEALLGSVYEYYAEALDNLVFQGGDTPREAHLVRSDKGRIVVQDPAAVAQARLKEAMDLYGRLQRLLELQREAREWIGSLATLAPEAAVARVKDTAFRQKEIRQQTIVTVQEVRFDRETAPVKVTLEMLIQNQMRDAELRSQSLAEAVAAGPDRELQHGLAATQNEIIVILERLLEVAQGQIRVAESALGKGGTDLPPDVQEKLRNLADKLKEFIEQQKKVIEETEKLAKKPADDFTTEDRQKLQELVATEDKWEKFMADAISDLSNLPQLDASNPSLLKELIEAKVDIEMAKDALKKDAVEIAVALENAGVELAQEIVENLERWLPDTPDRIKWSMEEPMAPMEIPNAELPEQLEDLVGDLLEQEEDVFDEMEDATSGWADSLDKGAGWDAMDGPISNYSAKGVTGNQLPNSSEIGGRSGEGRTGRSSGEFVEESATGKGGRRTPTRVTNDPFTQGEIQDTSKDPPGGATGGGKVSGSGQEGLEGPVPRQVEREMQRLAGRQAEIRAKAEKINVDLKVSNYENFNLDEAVRGMRRVERELLAGRYENAMREKHVILNELKGSKMLLGGEVRVRSDRRSDLPDEYRKEIEEASKAPMPEGYEALLKSYYERLSQGE